MGYLIILIIAAVIGTILAWEDEFGTIGFLCGGMVGIVICLIVGGAVYSGAKQVETKTASQPIYALDNGSGTSGAFFLGSGVIDKTEKYTYLTNADKGMQIQTIDVDNAYVKEDNTQSPELITYTSDYASPALRFWFPQVSPSETYQFIIPKGSIKYNYNVDVSK